MSVAVVRPELSIVPAPADVILRFDGEDAFLSNFSAYPVRWHDIGLHATHQAAQSALAQTVRQRWDTITDQHGVPATPDRLTDKQAIDLYFARSPSWSHCSLYLDDVDGDLVPVEVF